MVITAAGTWQVQDWPYEETLAGIERAQTLAIAEAGKVIREEEQRCQTAVNKEASDPGEQYKAAAVDAGIANVTGDRLHADASKLAATACGDPGAVQRGALATRAAMMLYDLFQRADKNSGRTGDRLRSRENIGKDVFAEL